MEEGNEVLALVLGLLFWAVGLLLIYVVYASNLWANKAIKITGKVVRVNKENRTERIETKNGDYKIKKSIS